MKKAILGLMLAAAISMPLCVIAADAAKERAANPVEQLTGTVWQNSKQENKLAVLFGIDTAIAVENAIQERLAQDATKAHKKAPHTLSTFEKNWMEAFKNMTREEIVAQVDQWYTANPDKLDRPVLEVIWYELIVPRTSNK